MHNTAAVSTHDRVYLQKQHTQPSLSIQMAVVYRIYTFGTICHVVISDALMKNVKSNIYSLVVNSLGAQ